jgi:hypothetical protein
MKGYRLRMLDTEVRMLRRIFGPKQEEVSGCWGRLHIEELHNLYASPNNIRVIMSRKIRWTVHVAHMGETRSAHKLLVRKSEGKRPLGRPRRRWEDNIRKYLREIGWEGVEWMHLDQDRIQWWDFVKTVRNLRVTQRGGFLDKVSYC